MFRFACSLLALVAVCSAAAIPEDAVDHIVSEDVVDSTVQEDGVNRIVGGSNAQWGQIPWQVSVQNLNSHHCGGSIVNQRWILTAAHCLARFSPVTITVVTNALLLNSGGDVYRASRLVVHPNYDANVLLNDVGLIEVASNIVYRSNIVEPARLPTSYFGASNYPGVVSGWGLTSPGGSVANALQVLNVNIIAQSQCQASSSIVTSDNICTVSSVGQGPCNQDSGGPLTADGVLIGLVSFGTSCAVGLPDVYARVFSFLPWIRGFTG